MSRIAKIGPWGGGRGDPRDIKQSPILLVDVSVYTNGTLINALKFSYMDDTGVVHTEGPWGLQAGLNAEVIKLSPGNYIQEISGTYGATSYGQTMKSLKFVTNSGKEYQYGEANGEAFKIPVSQNGKIVAFFARSGHVLDALGVYILP